MDTSSRELGEEEEEMGDTFRTDRAAHVKAEVDGRGVEVARKDRRDAVAEATDEDEDEDDGRCPGNGRRTPRGRPASLVWRRRRMRMRRTASPSSRE